MRNLLLAVLAIPLLHLPGNSNQPSAADRWASYRFLMGDWVGEEDGQVRPGKGRFSFAPELQGRILVRKNRADFPASAGGPAFSHEDLLIIYQEDGSKEQKAILEGKGQALLSESEDIANARLRFANGCVANLTASRVSPDKMRKIRVFSSGPMTSYISLDYRAQEGFIYRIAREGEEESSLLKKLLKGKDTTIVSQFGGKRIVREPVPIQKEEPLELELRNFIESVRAHETPLVSGESAKRALDLAFEITRQIHRTARPT